MATSIQAILLATGLWHALAAWHFLFYPERSLRRLTRERPANSNAVELLRFLGGLNAALFVWAWVLAVSCPANAAVLVLAGFALINFSQFVLDLRIGRLGRAHGPMFRILTGGDGFFFLLNAVAAYLL